MKSITIRFADDLYSEICQIAESRGIKNLSLLVREALRKEGAREDVNHVEERIAAQFDKLHRHIAKLEQQNEALYQLFLTVSGSSEPKPKPEQLRLTDNPLEDEYQRVVHRAINGSTA